MRKIKEIIIHCSDARRSNAATIDKWHKARGWKEIGYHLVILKDGEFQAGRDLNKIGAHTYKHNRYTIGICLEGRGFQDFTFVQMRALKAIVSHYCSQYGVKKITNHWHYNKEKTCPNFDFNKFFEGCF